MLVLIFFLYTACYKMVVQNIRVVEYCNSKLNLNIQVTCPKKKQYCVYSEQFASNEI